METANIVLGKQVDRLYDRAAKVTVKARVADIRELEQAPREANILLNFLNVAYLGTGNFFPVKAWIIFFVSAPDILKIDTPATPGPEERA